MRAAWKESSHVTVLVRLIMAGFFLDSPCTNFFSFEVKEINSLGLERTIKP